jgi:hypothetical protein
MTESGIPRRPLVALLALVGLTGLAACDDSEQVTTDPVREPYPGTRPLPEVEKDDLWLPDSFQGAKLLEPGWQSTPLHADGVYLGAAERKGVLEFTAVDDNGEFLWAVQRPLSCSGFAVTTDSDGRGLAVLSDVGSDDDSLSSTTVTGYDIGSGDVVWGPVDVPGPHQGPGLVYATPPAEAMGETGPRTALDPDTGEIAHSEADDDERIIGEYQGVLLLADDEDLLGRNTSDAEELWRIPLPESLGEVASVRAATKPSPSPDLALIETSESTGALIDLDAGTIRHKTVREAALDLTTNTLVTLAEVALDAYDLEDDAALWSVAVQPETTIAAAGGVLLYLREGGSIRVHNSLTGDVAAAYDPEGSGRIAVPVHITQEGAAILLDGERYLLAALHGESG